MESVATSKQADEHVPQEALQQVAGVSSILHLLIAPPANQNIVYWKCMMMRPEFRCNVKSYGWSEQKNRSHTIICIKCLGVAVMTAAMCDQFQTRGGVERGCGAGTKNQYCPSPLP